MYKLCFRATKEKSSKREQVFGIFRGKVQQRCRHPVAQRSAAGQRQQAAQSGRPLLLLLALGKAGRRGVLTKRPHPSSLIQAPHTHDRLTIAPPARQPSSNYLLQPVEHWRGSKLVLNRCNQEIVQKSKQINKTPRLLPAEPGLGVS